PNVNSPQNSSIAGGPTSMATGLFNNDAFLDLAVTVPDSTNPTTANGVVVILLNGGTTGGNWNGFTSQTNVTAGKHPNGIATGRFRGGPLPVDIAVANTSDTGGSVMRINNTGGASPTFSVGSTLTNVGTNPVALAAADLDGNGSIDLAVANSGI